VHLGGEQVPQETSEDHSEGHAHQGTDGPGCRKH